MSAMTSRESALLAAVSDVVRKKLASAPSSPVAVTLPPMPSLPPIDMTPVADAIRDCDQAFNQSLKFQKELFEKYYAPPPAIDMTPVADAIREFAKIIQSLVEAMPTKPPVVNVQPAVVNVKVPEAKAPVVKMPRIVKSVAKFKRDKDSELTESTTEHTYDER